jgi:dihydrodipicolinate synthase/N-acetylneuraminate lyase
VQIYQLDAGHGMRPTADEQEAYYDEVAGAVPHPLALSLHVNAGYVPPIAQVATICERYPHIVAINVIGLPAATFVALRDAVPSRVALYTRLADAMTGLALGAAGTLSAENNIAPRLCGSVLARWQDGDTAAAGAALADVLRLSAIVNQWAPSTARWIKMAMKVLALPGGEGGLRSPYRMPAQAELDAMAAAFRAMDLMGREAKADPWPTLGRTRDGRTTAVDLLSDKPIIGLRNSERED